MKIVVTEDAAFVEHEGRNVADIAFIGGLATMLYGSGEGIAASIAELATRQDAELRCQAIEALANDFCPPHLEASKLDMQKAVQEGRHEAGQKCTEHFDARWEWAREIAPTLAVERR